MRGCEAVNVEGGAKTRTSDEGLSEAAAVNLKSRCTFVVFPICSTTQVRVLLSDAASQ